MAEVRQTFRASRIGTIAGCHVTQGKITRNAKVRLVRDGTIVYDGAIASLKRFKDDVTRGRGGLRVRHRARELPGRQGRRRDRGLRDAQGRAQSSSSVGVAAAPCRSWSPSRSISTCPDNGSLKGKRKELLSVRAALAPALRRIRRRGGRPGPVAARDARRRPRGAHGRRARARRGRDRALSARRFPDGVRVERRLRVVRGPRRLSAQLAQRAVARARFAGMRRTSLYSRTVRHGGQPDHSPCPKTGCAESTKRCARSERGDHQRAEGPASRFRDRHGRRHQPGSAPRARLRERARRRAAARATRSPGSPPRTATCRRGSRPSCG